MVTVQKDLVRRRSPQLSQEVLGHGAKSDAVRERAILALMSETTLARAASRCGVSEKTLRRWLTHDGQFQEEYAAARATAFQASMYRVQMLAAKAIDALEDLLGEKNHPGVRLGAVRTVVDLALHQHELESLNQRLDDIERRVRGEEQA